MFDTIQIARRHMLRFEYPELAASLDSSASPIWLGGVTDAVSAWFGGKAPGPEPERESEQETETEEPELTLAAVWQAYPYF